jgi:hypothetical protein
MSRLPFDEAEIGGAAQDLGPVAEALERYAASSDSAEPADLSERILAAVNREPIPRRSLAARLGGLFGSARGGRLLVAAALASVVFAGAVLAGQLVDTIRDVDVGDSPSADPTPTVTPSPIPSEQPSPTPSPTEAPTTPRATPDEASPLETERPSPTASEDDDEDDDDNSGPGGGGDDDNSGPGGGGGSGSGSDDD